MPSTFISTLICAKLMAVREAKEEKFLMAMMNNILSGHTCGMPTKSNLHFPAQSALLAVFLQRAGSRSTSLVVKNWKGKKTKKFGCDFVGCWKRYVTQSGLHTQKAEVHNPTGLLKRMKTNTFVSIVLSPLQLKDL